MLSELAFLKAIVKDPADEPTRLVFADWLEERGDPRAGVVRGRPEIFHFIASLKTAQDTPSAEINQFVEAGEADLLAAMASFVKVSLGLVRNRRQSWVPRQTLEQLTDALAITPGLAAVDAVLRTVSEVGEKQPVCREFAAKLAQGQPHDLLLATMAKQVEDPALGEFRACLLQETVLRGVSLDGQPVAERIWAKLRGEGHPLAPIDSNKVSQMPSRPRWMKNAGKLKNSRCAPFRDRHRVSNACFSRGSCEANSDVALEHLVFSENS